MSLNKNPNTFFDSRTIIALILTGFVFVGWQTYMKKKYPETFNKKVKQEETVKPLTGAEAANKEDETKIKLTETEKTSGEAILENEIKQNILPEEQKIKISNDVWDLEFSSYGFQIKHAEIKKYKERDFTFKKFDNLFLTSFLSTNEPIIFDLTQDGNVIEGTYNEGSNQIKKTITLNEKNYSMDVDYQFTGEFKGISTFIEMPLVDNIKSSFFMPNYETQEYFTNYKGETKREVFKVEDFSSRIFEQVKILAIGTHFFGQAIVDKSTLKPNALVFYDSKDKKAVARMDYTFSPQVRSFKINQKYFIGPKDDTILKSVDSDLIELIDFGFFKFLAYPILKVLKFFYSLVSNYGVAIILLTLLIRLLVFPLAYRGYKSMSEMQKIQPQLKAIREKHKADPQKANVETMALMKEHKVNPLGGCMPMLLQLPIFFAFYQVLLQSVVMYQAPFALWINDLSLKDPYFILPILMGLVMFIQQKMTPTAMDPMQQKIMQFMPVMFAFFMISLPSALTLYIFVSTLVGVLQQYIFNKSKSTSTTIVKKQA